MRQIARAMQLTALVLLPLSMVLQVARALTVGQMLVAMLAGFALFWIGRILEGYLRT
ncbi:MAG TPA: hypothetical protein VFI31_29585 [Pirellulales bacterium]|nr:hypothetical protein [Pirellulales bacterium]